MGPPTEAALTLARRAQCNALDPPAHLRVFQRINVFAAQAFQDRCISILGRENAHRLPALRA
jgi:hypothetical protein